MTQRNIYVMDQIVNKMADGTKLSKALKDIYTKRNVCVPYSEEDLKTPITDLRMSCRTTNALLRTNLMTIKDVVKFCEYNKIMKIRNLGTASGIELFEAILDYCWERMNSDKRTDFLIDTVERNSEYIRAEIAQ